MSIIGTKWTRKQYPRSIEGISDSLVWLVPRYREKEVTVYILGHEYHRDMMALRRNGKNADFWGWVIMKKHDNLMISKCNWCFSLEMWHNGHKFGHIPTKALITPRIIYRNSSARISVCLCILFHARSHQEVYSHLSIHHFSIIPPQNSPKNTKCDKKAQWWEWNLSRILHRTISSQTMRVKSLF